MASGCRSLEREALPAILEQLQIHNGFSLLIVGYSLGAGLAQLFTRYVEQLQGAFMGRISTFSHQDGEVGKETSRGNYGKKMRSRKDFS